MLGLDKGEKTERKMSNVSETSLHCTEAVSSVVQMLLIRHTYYKC